LEINVHIYFYHEYVGMRLMNRKSFISLLVGSSVSVWVAQTRFIQSRWLAPDFQFLRQSAGLLGALCDAIIPRTDTPGASDTLTHEFVASYVEHGLPRSLQVIFIEGLKKVDGYAFESFGKSFPQCTPQEQNSILVRIERSDKLLPGLAGKVEQKITGKPFFQQLKAYTVLGYCTSKPVATGVLNYDPVPGAYQGCIEFKVNQNCNYSS
jgi:hypothetical protein